MNKDKDFDLKSFQSEVLKDFQELRVSIVFTHLHSKGVKSVAEETDTDLYSFSGAFITRGLLKFFSFLGKKSKVNLLDKPEFIELNRKAERILDDPRIKKILCPKLNEELSPDMIKEEIEIKLVSVVTKSLTPDKIVKEFSIQRDVRLFSLIAINVLRKDNEFYCE